MRLEDVDYVSRKEIFAIVNWNTIRMNDVPIMAIDFSPRHRNLTEEEMNTIMCKYVVSRPTKYIEYRENSEVEYYKRLISVYPKSFNTAPESDAFNSMMASIDTVAVETVYMLYPTFGLIEPESIIPDYLEEECNNRIISGTVESLEEFINENGVTSLFIDDIDYVYELVSRGKINVRGMTFFVSIIGYNFVKNENRINDDDSLLMYKHYEFIAKKTDELNFEVGFIQVWQSDEDDLKNALSKLNEKDPIRIVLGGGLNE